MAHIAKQWHSKNKQLTDDEIETLQQISRCLPAKVVGENLGVVKRTIDFRLGEIYYKLGVSSAFEAWILALQAHLLKYEPSMRTDNEGVYLTEQEREVLASLARGKVPRDIGRELKIKKRTVDFHLNNIYQKLDVNCRFDAVKEGVRHGFVPQPGS